MLEKKSFEWVHDSSKQRCQALYADKRVACCLNYRLAISVPTLQVSQKKGKSQQPNTGTERSHFHKEAVIINLKRSQQKGQQSPDLGLPQAFS
jgi:hypothetical protein